MTACRKLFAPFVLENGARAITPKAITVCNA
jgi:hypothetical protein